MVHDELRNNVVQRETMAHLFIQVNNVSQKVFHTCRALFVPV